MDNLELKKRVSQPAREALKSEVKDCKDEGKFRPLPSDRTVGIVFFSLLIDLLAFTVILPLFPSLLEFYASNKEVRPSN